VTEKMELKPGDRMERDTRVHPVHGHLVERSKVKQVTDTGVVFTNGTHLSYEKLERDGWRKL
jgi:hypothetical protein